MSSFVCHHPHTDRWFSPGGVVQVCRSCSECRRGELQDEHWPAARRVIVTENGRVRMYSPDRKRLYQSRPLRADAHPPPGDAAA